MTRSGAARMDWRVWLGLTVVLSAAAAWVLAHGYLNEGALIRWTKISTVLGADESRLENLGLLYPHLPIYLLAPMYFVPGLATPFAPYLLSAVIGATLLTLWYAHLRQRHCGRSTAMLLVVLVALHPMFLWAATNGSERSLSLLAFYLMCLAGMRLLRVGDVRAVMMLGLVLALYFFVDERTSFLFLALLPLLPFLAPPRMLRESTLSTYVLISLPIAVAALAWAYLNWLFNADPWHFVTSGESAFVGASRAVAGSDWLRQVGGRLLPALGWAAALAALALPVLGWTLWHLRGRRRMWLGIGILALHPVLATALATVPYVLGQPLDILFLMLGAAMVAVLLLPKAWAQQGGALVFWFALSAAGGWAVFTLAPGEDLGHWRAAVSGQTQHDAHAADIRVGQWLAVHRQPTWIDSRAAFRVVAARGDAVGLWLPFMPAFKVAERLGAVEVDQVVVVDPRHPRAARDRITQRFPTLFDNGQPGYELALSDPPWRVYRRSGSQVAALGYAP